jgi:hypothetical protein
VDALRKNIIQYIKNTLKPLYRESSVLAGETRFEHATNGFGDHYSTVEPLPYESYLIIYYIVYEVNRNIEVFYEL